MHGGEFIAKGTYGCVFGPAVKCTDGREFPKKIGKVYFDESGYIDENNIAKILDKIDRKQSLLIYPDDISCKVSKAEILKNDKKNSCRIRNSPQNFDQMIMSYGGMSLFDYLQNMEKKLSRKEALLLIKNVFLGVQKLVHNKLVHQDIKSANIVVDKDGVSRLIDFGFITNFENFNNNFLFKHDYFLNGPEYRLIMFKGELKKTMRSLRNNLNKYGYLQDWKKDGLYIVDDNYIKSLEEYLLSYKKNCGSKVYESSPIISRCHNHEPEKSDIYSLGLIIMAMYPFIIPVSKDDKDITMKFNNMLYRMLRPKPEDRPDIDSLVKTISSIVSLKPKTPSPVVKNEKIPIKNPPAAPRDCPPGKIRNPKTGKCVSATGKIGQGLVPKPDCPPGKIRNPKTGRCVNSNGKIGLQLLVK